MVSCHYIPWLTSRPISGAQMCACMRVSVVWYACGMGQSQEIFFYMRAHSKRAIKLNGIKTIG